MPPVPVLLMVRELGIGGCERDLSKIARALDRSRFSPFAGCFHGEGLRTQELLDASIPIVEFPVRSFQDRSLFRGISAMRRFLQQERIQVVHAFDTPTNIFAVPVARLSGVRAVCASRLWDAQSIPPLHWRLSCMAEKLAHRIVVNSRSVGAGLEAAGVRPDRIFLNYNGVETGVFHARGRTRVAPMQHATTVIGSVCALREEKRLDVLIDAFAEVYGGRPGSRLLIVGDGPMEMAWKERVRKLHLESQCHFEPARSDVQDWMRSMDIFVLPSDTESFPNALLEAMACGCAVIGSNVGGIPEMLDPDRAGLIFERGDVAGLARALRRMQQDPCLQTTLGVAAGQRAAQDFSIENAARRLEGLYSTLLG